VKAEQPDGKSKLRRVDTLPHGNAVTWARPFGLVDSEPRRWAGQQAQARQHRQQHGLRSFLRPDSGELGLWLWLPRSMHTLSVR